MMKMFLKYVIYCTLLSPLFYSDIMRCEVSANMWWCAGCGLAYPASQKFCLNQDCPLYRKKR